jgi:hypothetical protein
MGGEREWGGSGRGERKENEMEWNGIISFSSSYLILSRVPNTIINMRQKSKHASFHLLESFIPKFELMLLRHLKG